MAHHHDDIQITEDNYDDYYRDHEFMPVAEHAVGKSNRYYPRVAWALDVAREIKPKHVLDLGCLDGFAVCAVVNNSDVNRGTGVDLSEKGVNLGRKHAKRLNLNIDFIQDNIVNFVSKSLDDYDMIMMFEVIEHFLDADQVIKMLHENMKPGATLLVTTPAFESPIFGADDEENHVHLRLYTTADEDYKVKNSYGNEREATSITKAFKDWNIEEVKVVNQLIHLRVTK